MTDGVEQDKNDRAHRAPSLGELGGRQVKQCLDVLRTFLAELGADTPSRFRHREPVVTVSCNRVKLAEMA